MIVKGVFLLPGLPPPGSSLRPHSLLYWAVIISAHVGVGTQKKRGVHFPHTLFFPFPISLPLNYINEYSASLHSLHTRMILLAWPLLGMQGTEYQSVCHPQGWTRLPQAPALTSQHILCVYEPILGLREVKAV